MHYIRFLKPPAIRQHGTERYIAALLTLNTDLGDEFYIQDVELNVILSINDNRLSDYLAECTVKWRAGMRALPFKAKLKPLSKLMSCFVEVAAKDPMLGQVDLVGGSMHLPVIIPARNIMIVAPRGPAEADKMLLRTINLGSDVKLLIWEEAGDSIARHVWDAGMAVVSLFAYSRQLAMHLPQIGKLLGENRYHPLEILELGTGTGLTGLALARTIQRTSVLLTDVAEVEALVNRNIASNKTASGSSVQFRPLDWSDQMPSAISERRFDLIIASDVTYNPDSSEDLVGTIATIAESSPAALVLIAMKKRHASEHVFFRLMTKSMFSIIAKTDVLAPRSTNHDDTEMAERVELFTFRKQ